MGSSEIINPLYGVTIGSTIFSHSGEFSSTVVNKPLSVMISQEESRKSMSGESSYVYSEKMNQGSFGMSGAYGVSGISLVKSSLSAYVGKSSAKSSKSVTVNYNATSIGGVEYINFEELTAANFLAGLNLACQQSSLAVLDVYNAVMAETAKLGVDLITALLEKNPKYDGLKQLVSKWVKVSEKFTSEFGDGMVVGVVWGALGGVIMQMTSESGSDSWKYGGQADFSYASTVASVAVKATYDGSQSGGEANVTVNCDSYVSGSVLAGQISEWFAKVAGKSFDFLAGVSVMDKAPDMRIAGGAPAIPEFVKPKPAERIASKVGEIKDLKGLEALAKASAYDEAKKKKSDLTLEEFLRKSEEPSDTEKLEDMWEMISDNDVDPLGLLVLDEEEEGVMAQDIMESDSEILPAKSLLAADERNAGREVNTSGYVPLGVWISNWADLFPWMAQGYYNSIDNLEGENAVKERVMLQDYQSLSRLYYIAHASGITEFKRKNQSLPNMSTLSIADAFANAASEMQANQGNIVMIKKIFNGLGEAAQQIYTKWCEIAFLRNCELGLGLIKNKKSIGDPIPNNETNNDHTRQAYSMDDCDFDGSNYTIFGRFYKVLPLLTPDGDIWAFGPVEGGLSSVYDRQIVFSKPGRAKYLVFDWDKHSKTLSNSDNQLKLYPIPFSAAKNIKWKGMSFSTNIGADQSLIAKLKFLEEQLAKLSAWSFSSSGWNIDWNGKDAYRQRNIKKQYLGLIEEIRNVF